jgi:hypothetical protein
MRNSSLAAVVLSSLVACRMFDKEQSKSGEAAAASSKAATSAASAAGSVNAKVGRSPDKPLEWAPGQWTRHRVKFGNSNSVLTYKVLRHEGDEYLLEVVAQNPAQGDTIMQINMLMNSVLNAKEARIKSARLRFPGGKVQEFNGKLLGPVQNLYKNLLGFMSLPDVGSLDRTDVTVTAGRFEGCFKNATSTADIMGVKSAGTSFVHFSVPISATVKVEGKDGTSQMELLAFGLTGAKSEL